MSALGIDAQESFDAKWAKLREVANADVTWLCVIIHLCEFAQTQKAVGKLRIKRLLEVDPEIYSTAVAEVRRELKEEQRRFPNSCHMVNVIAVALEQVKEPSHAQVSVNCEWNFPHPPNKLGQMQAAGLLILRLEAGPRLKMGAAFKPRPRVPTPPLLTSTRPCRLPSAPFLTLVDGRRQKQTC